MSRPSFPYRQLLASLVTALLVATGTWYVHHAFWNYNLRDIVDDLHDELARDTWLIQARLRGRAGDFLILKQIAEADLARKPAGSLENFRVAVKTLMYSRNVYDSIRLIDPAGHEAFRCDLKASDRNAEVVEAPVSALQDKSDRPYFTEARDAAPDAVVYSPLRLAHSHGVLEEPAKPNVHVSGRIDGPDGKLHAVLVVNYLASQLFRELRADPERRIRYLNADGYWLVGPEPEKEWTFMKPGAPQANLRDDDPALWERINRDREGWVFSDDTLRCYVHLDPLDPAIDYPVLRMPLLGRDAQRAVLLAEVPGDVLRGEIARIDRAVWLGGALAMLVLVPAMWSVISSIERRKTALRNLHATLSELQTSQASLRDALGHLEDFSSSVAHDFRGPLRNIQNYAEILDAEEPSLTSEGRRMLGRILFASKRLNQLAVDLLEYSKVGMGELPLAPLDLDFLLADLLRENDDFASSASIDVRSPLGAVVGNRTGLHLSLLNLLLNGIKYSKPGLRPHLVVRTEVRAGLRRLWVEDNGIGIDAAHQERIFNVFERLDPREDSPGTGIGLALVRKAVAKMGGAVGVESQPGVGSRFWIDLPEA